MKISKLPSIKYDECLSSWLIRSAEIIGEGQVMQYLECAEDVDFDLQDKRTLAFLSGMGVTAELANKLFGAETDWLFSHEQRIAYCLLCFQDDISSGISPYWRKSWCYLHCPICTEHNCLLFTSEPIIQGWHKAWNIFIDECNGSYQRDTRCRLEWRQPPTSIGLVQLAARVQNFIVRAHKQNCIRLPGSDCTVSRESLLAVVRVLLERFLLPRMRASYRDGISRGMQTGLPRVARVSSIEKAIEIGCNDPDAFPRMTSLILVGCVLKLFPMSLFHSLKNSLALPVYVNSGEAFDIGFYGLKPCSFKDRQRLVDFFRAYKDEFEGYFDSLIQGLIHSR